MIKCHWHVCSEHSRFKDARGDVPGLRLEDADRSFDIEFWQRQGSAAIFAAAWEMVVFANKFKGRDASELTFQRTLTKIKRVSS